MSKRILVIVAAISLWVSAARGAEEPSESDRLLDQLHDAAKQGNHKLLQKYHLELLKERAKPDCERVDGGKDLWAWLTAPSRESLLTELLYAIPPKGDPLPVFKTLKELWAANPNACQAFPDLTIAFSIVWSRPKPITPFDDTKRLGVKGVPGPPRMAESFDYYVKNLKQFPVNPRQFPWQLLLYVACDNTPIEERMWVLKNYTSPGKPYGKVYSDVPYDYGLLTNATPKMSGKEYTLADLKKYGGVCAHQADYAQKVLRSLCIPAMLVRGESRFGGYHAWIGWFEPAAGGPVKSYKYSFYGNYLIDRYYTGQVQNLFTKKWDIMDRDIELEVRALSLGEEPYRTARTLDRCYALLSHLPKDKRLDLLTDAVNTNPYYGPAWLKLGELCREKKLSESEGLKLINVMLKKFAAYPDLTFRVLGDFAALLPKDDPGKLNTLYSQAYDIYKRAGRPDLASDLKIAQGQLLEEAGHGDLACKAYAQGATEFPEEGRTVGRLAAGVGRICRNNKRPQIALALLTPLLRKIPPYAREKPVALVNTAYLDVAGEIQGLYMAANDNENASRIEKKITALKSGQ